MTVSEELKRLRNIRGQDILRGIGEGGKEIDGSGDFDLRELKEPLRLGTWDEFGMLVFEILFYKKLYKSKKA